MTGVQDVPVDFYVPHCVASKNVFNSLEFLVSELLASKIIKHKNMHPEETTEGQSEKEQRLKDPSHEEDENDDFGQKDQRIAEVQAEWVLLLHALDMDTSSEFPDVLSEVRLGVCSRAIS